MPQREAALAMGTTPNEGTSEQQIRAFLLTQKGRRAVFECYFSLQKEPTRGDIYRAPPPDAVHFPHYIFWDEFRDRWYAAKHIQLPGIPGHFWEVMDPEHGTVILASVERMKEIIHASGVQEAYAIAFWDE